MRKDRRSPNAAKMISRRLQHTTENKLEVVAVNYNCSYGEEGKVGNIKRRYSRITKNIKSFIRSIDTNDLPVHSSQYYQYIAEPPTQRSNSKNRRKETRLFWALTSLVAI